MRVKCLSSNCATKAIAAVSVMAACMASAACSTASSPGYGSSPSEVSIAWLRSMSRDASTTIRDDVSIRGRVTANDAYGEFFKSIVVEDTTGGIEILFDLYNLHRTFPLYAEVTLHCQGLALGRYGSMLFLGERPTGEYVVDRIAAADTRRFTIRRAENDADMEFPTVTIPELEPRHIGRTVRTEPLTAEGGRWCDYDPETGAAADTERTATDSTGNTLRILLDRRCEYAEETMPHGGFTLCGIVEYRDGGYALRIANRGIFEM